MDIEAAPEGDMLVIDEWRCYKCDERGEPFGSTRGVKIHAMTKQDCGQVVLPAEAGYTLRHGQDAPDRFLQVVQAVPETADLRERQATRRWRQ